MMETSKGIITEELERLRLRIIGNMQRNGQVASGRTIASMRVEATETEGTLFGRSPFGTLETGRKAGRIPYGFVQIIYDWMQAKGLHGTNYYKTQRAHKYDDQTHADLSLAGAIAYKIKHEGTSLFRSGGRSDVYSNEIPETIERIKKRILSALYKTEFEHIKLNNK